MSGILASSVAHTMVEGDTDPDKSVAGYLLSEAIALSAFPAPSSSASWGISKPSGATSRSDLSDSSSRTPSFTPDVAGYYVVTCTVDGVTAYVIRLAVAQVAITTPYEAIRLQPLEDEQVIAPTLGACLYWSATQNALAIKLPDDSVSTVNVTPV